MAGQGATALFNVMLNLWLIPKIGYVGAALATLLTEVFLFIIYYLYVSRSLHLYNFIGVLAKPTTAVIVMFLFIKFTNLGLTFTVVISAFVYFAALFILKALDRRDYGIIKKIFKNENLQKD